MRSRNFIGIPSFFLLVGTAKSKQNALTTSKPTSNLAKRILLKIISPFIRGQCFQTQQCRGCAVTSCTHCRVAPPGLALTPLLGGVIPEGWGGSLQRVPSPRAWGQRGRGGWVAFPLPSQRFYLLLSQAAAQDWGLSVCALSISILLSCAPQRLEVCPASTQGPSQSV